MASCMVAKYSRLAPFLRPESVIMPELQAAHGLRRQPVHMQEELNPGKKTAACGNASEEERKSASLPAAAAAANSLEAPLPGLGGPGPAGRHLQQLSGQSPRHPCTTGTASSPHADQPNPPSPPPWWEGHLAEEIHRTLKKREALLDSINLASPQLHKRAELIEFVSEVCDCLPLSNTTCHLAVLLLDHFMEKHDIMDYRLKLVALTCLLVAAKMEDRDDHLPSIGQLRRLAKLEGVAEYSRDEFQRMELYLMKFFDWSISYPTATHFIGYYNANCFLGHAPAESEPLPLSDTPFCLEGGVASSSSEMDFLDNIDTDLDLDAIPLIMDSIELEDMVGEWATPTLHCEQQEQKQQQQQGDVASLRYQLEEVTASLLEKALRDYGFLEYPPSVVAAAAVCAARISMNVSPSWTARLEGVSQCTRQLLGPVVELFARSLYSTN